MFPGTMSFSPTSLCVNFNLDNPPCTRFIPYVDVCLGIGTVGEVLIIHNISRFCDGIYACVAFNEVEPAVTRNIKVSVECMYIPDSWEFEHYVIYIDIRIQSKTVTSSQSRDIEK